MLDWLRDYKLPAVAVFGLCTAFVATFGYLHGNIVSRINSRYRMTQTYRTALSHLVRPAA